VCVLNLRGVQEVATTRIDLYSNSWSSLGLKWHPGALMGLPCQTVIAALGHLIQTK
jgi:hypothetical protein